MLDAVKHQDESVTFLRRWVAGGLTSPLLLVGPEGTGRRYAALQAIREVFCTQTERNTHCRCVDCAQLASGCHPDLLELVAGNKDIGVDAARSAITTLGVYPTQVSLRVVLIDGADRMTAPAANALLKTLEEPPVTARVLLLAESLASVLPTVRSRCGVLNFRPLPEDFILSKVQPFESNVTKALVYARLGEGSVGRAIQYWGSGRLALRDKALNLLSLALAKDLAGVFLLVDQLEKELPLFLRFLSTLIHDVLLLDVAPQYAINLDVLDTLKDMTCCPTSTWLQLQRDLQSLVAVSRSTRIQLAFHVKTLFVQTLFKV